MLNSGMMPRILIHNFIFILVVGSEWKLVDPVIKTSNVTHDLQKWSSLVGIPVPTKQFETRKGIKVNRTCNAKENIIETELYRKIGTICPLGSIWHAAQKI